MKILVVDDEKDMETLFQQRFRKEIRDKEVEFAFASSGEEALRYLAQLRHEAVLILSDINMPGMSGLATCREIRASSEIAIIMLTVSDSEDDKVAALEAVCARHGVALKAAALQFPLHHPCVATVIPGMRNPDEIADNLAMLHAPIPADLWRELKEASLIDPAAPTP